MQLDVQFGNIPIGHMSSFTAACFLLVSLALLCHSTSAPEPRVCLAAAWWLACAVSGISLVWLLAYLYGTPVLYGGMTIPPAMTTSLAFIGLGLALMRMAVPPSPPPSLEAKPSARHFLAVFLALSVGVIFAGLQYYRKLEKQFRVTIEQQLSAIADLKVSDIAQWRRERLGDAAVLHNNPNFSGLVQRYLENPAEGDSQIRLQTWLDHVQSAYQYESVFLLDAEGRPRLAMPGPTPDVMPDFEAPVAEAFRRGSPGFMDFHRHSPDEPVHLSVLVPLFADATQREPLGLLVLRVDPRTYLYPLVTRWPNPSRTAETLLVRREEDEAVFLNELRFATNTALRLRFSITNTVVPAVRAVLGEEGIIDGRDYRGVPVIACVRAIPDSPWFMVARMDRSELVESLRWRLWELLAIIGVVLVTTGAVMGSLWRRQEALRYRRKFEAAEAERRHQERYRRTLDSMMEGCQILSPEGRYLYVNEAAARHGRRPRAELEGHLITELYPGIEQTPLFEEIRRCRAEQVAIRMENEFVYPDGDRGWFELSLQPAPEGVFVLSADITERKQAERLQFLSAGVLEILNRTMPLQDAAAGVMALIRRETGLDAAGIRLKQGEDFPYLGTDGLSDEFVVAENFLAARSDDGGFCRDENGQVCLECTCGLVLSEKCGPSGDSVTPAGSFWTADAVSLAASLHENDPRRRPRDRCLHVGFQSVALIPIRVGGQIIGLLHLAGRKKGLFTADTVHFFEGLAASLGIAIARKQAEEQLRESRDRLNFALEKSHTGGWELDLMNHAAIRSLEHDRIFGYPELLPHWTYEMFLEHVIPEDRAGVNQRFQDAIAAQKDWSVECRIRRRDGEIRWILAIGGHQRDENGQARRMAGIVRDITERKQVEERIRHLTEVLRAVRNVNQLITHEKDPEALVQKACAILTETRGYRSAWISLADSDGRLRAAAESGLGDGFTAVRTQMEKGESPECCRLVLARSDIVVVHNTERNCAHCPMAQTYRDTAALAGPLRHGDRHYGVIVVALPRGVADDAEEQSLFRELIGDIGFALYAIEAETERTRMVEALRANEERYRELVENLSDMVFSVSAEGLLTYVSPAAKALFGFAPEEVVGHSFAEFIHPQDLSAVQASFADSLAGRYYASEFRVLARDGSERWVRSTSRRRREADPAAGINGILSDITELRRASEALRQNEAFTTAVLDNLPVGVAVNSVDPSVSFHYMNDNFPRFYRTTREALAKPDGFWSAVYEDPEFREAIRKKIIEDCASGQPERMYWTDVPIARAGRETAYVTARNIPVPGKPLMISTVWDVTERKKAEAEIRQLNTELEERVRLRTAQLEASNKELEAFAYSVSHDLRAPLRAIDGFSRIVMEDFTGKMDAEAVRLLNVVRENTRQMDRLITDLLALSRATRTEVRSVPVDMTGLARSVYRELVPPGEAARSEFILPDLPSAHGDPTLLRQVWFNLLGNALKYSASRENRRIEVGAREGNREQVYFVKDNGVGFDPQYQAKLFGIFQRLHKASEFEGSGIGLAIVQRIMVRHGGRVWAEGKVGEGATFYFAVPRVAGDAATEARRPPEGMDIK
ncbi:MAG: PAS domain S-box protein [Kiritimatiellae bacterium]|nr:PAS domain S-box protein [Kiritimatiellia bacterium]